MFLYHSNNIKTTFNKVREFDIKQQGLDSDFTNFIIAGRYGSTNIDPDKDVPMIIGNDTNYERHYMHEDFAKLLSETITAGTIDIIFKGEFDGESKETWGYHIEPCNIRNLDIKEEYENFYKEVQKEVEAYRSAMGVESLDIGKKFNVNQSKGGNAMKATTIMAGTTGLEIKAGESKGMIKEGEKGDYEVKKGEIYLRVFEHPGKDGKNQKENYGSTIMKLSPQEAHKVAGALKTVAETREAKQSLYPVSPHKFEKDGKTTETVIAVSKDTFKDKQGNDKEAVVLNIGKGEENSKEKTWLKVNMTKDDAMYLSDFTKALAVEQSYENSKKVEKTQSQGAER
jgi:hypothetical protein